MNVDWYLGQNIRKSRFIPQVSLCENILFLVLLLKTIDFFVGPKGEKFL